MGADMDFIHKRVIEQIERNHPGLMFSVRGILWAFDLRMKGDIRYCGVMDELSVRQNIQCRAMNQTLDMMAYGHMMVKPPIKLPDHRKPEYDKVLSDLYGGK